MRCWFPVVLGLLFALFPAIAARAGDVYFSPQGAGSRSGNDAANARAYSVAALNAAIAAPEFVAGDTLYLLSGDYWGAGIVLSRSGEPSRPKRLVGLDTGGGRPRLRGAFNPASNAGSSDVVISIPGALSHWEVRNLEFLQVGVGIEAPSSGSTYTLRRQLWFADLHFAQVEDAMRLRNAEHVTVSDCTVFKHTKKGFRYGPYVRSLTFLRCHTDANGGDESYPTRSIPNGFMGEDTGGQELIRDITFIDCTARNNRYAGQSSGSYWNGDGFSTEEGTRNVTYIRCFAFDNHDGGFDDKASNVVYRDCVAVGNKRGFRYHAAPPLLSPMVTYENCLAAYNRSWGGTGSADGFWLANDTPVAGTARVVIDRSTAHNNGGAGVKTEGPGAMTVEVSRSILSVNGAWASGAFTQAASVAPIIVADSTVRHRPGTNADPGYTADSSGWRGDPATAFNSRTYGPTAGYFVRLAQTIQFAVPGELPFSLEPVKITASSDSGLPVSVRVVQGPAVREGDAFRLTGTGDVVVIAEQEGDAIYLPADAVTRVLRVLTNYDAWRATQFTLTNPEALENSRPLATAPDGVPWIMRYALGLPAAAPTLRERIEVSRAPNDAWSFVYRRPSDRPDLLFAVEWSSDLQEWQLAPSPVLLAVLGDDEVWESTLPTADLASVFWRLRVERR